MSQGTEKSRIEQSHLAVAGLGLLFAELQALSAMMPGVCGIHPHHDGDQSQREAEERQHDAEVEAAFDNMPV
jgi:hypothetical protein